MDKVCKLCLKEKALARPWKGPSEMPTPLSPVEMSTKDTLRQTGRCLREGGMLTFCGDGQFRSHLEAGLRGSKEGRKKARPPCRLRFVRPPLSGAVKVRRFGFTEGSGWFELLALLQLGSEARDHLPALPQHSLLFHPYGAEGEGPGEPSSHPSPEEGRQGKSPSLGSRVLVQPAMGGKLRGPHSSVRQQSWVSPAYLLSKPFF